MNDTASEIAARTLEILDQGWCQGFLETFDINHPELPASHCLGGAWNIAATGDYGWRIGSYDIDGYLAPLVDKIRSKYPAFANRGDNVLTVVYWNNSPGTTEEDVRLLLKEIMAEG